MMKSLQVCLAAVGLVCDLCRALMSNILPYCDEIMQLLLENLGVRNQLTVIIALISITQLLCFNVTMTLDVNFGQNPDE